MLKQALDGLVVSINPCQRTTVVNYAKYICKNKPANSLCQAFLQKYLPLPCISDNAYGLMAVLTQIMLNFVAG